MNEPALPQLPCLCASLRRATRALSQCYDAALRPHGLRGTQFTVLQALSITGEVTQGQLGEILAMDSTTLTRTLDILHRAGWISRRKGTDRREWWLRVSPSGKEQFQRAVPSWKKMQQKMARQLGDKRWHDIFQLTGQITALAIHQGELS
jgi:DNA-binding MarR family transcriptional regulator